MKEFAQGGWIKIKRKSYQNDGTFDMVYQLARLDEESKAEKGFFRHRLSDGMFVKPEYNWEVWIPNVGDTCWVTIDSYWIGDRPEELVGVVQLVKIKGVYLDSDSVEWETNGESYSTSMINCEPFIGLEPSLKLVEREDA